MKKEVHYYELGRGEKTPLRLKALRRVCELRPESSLDSSSAVIRALGKLDWKDAAEEYVYVIGCNKQLNPIAVFPVAHGGLDGCIVDTRSVFSRLLLCGAACFFLVHNHPSGHPQPSEEDKAITKKLKTAGKLLDIRLVDHIILGEQQGWSLETGCLYGYDLERQVGEQ